MPCFATVGPLRAHGARRGGRRGENIIVSGDDPALDVLMELLGSAVYAPRERYRRAKSIRTVAAGDEDAVTLGVEAARRVLASTGSQQPGAIVFATSSPPVLGLSLARLVSAALDLPPETAVMDVSGAARSGSAALLAASHMDVPLVLVVFADLGRAAPNTSVDLSLADVAAAMLVAPGSDGPMATFDRHALVGTGLADSWWTSDDEERINFADLRLAEATLAPACQAVLATLEIEPGTGVPIIISARPALGDRIARNLRAMGFSGASCEAQPVGYGGVAQVAIDMVNATDATDAGGSLVVLQCSDVCDGWLISTGVDATGTRRAPKSDEVVHAVVEPKLLDLETYLRRRGAIVADGPLRPPTAPVSDAAVARQARWKYAMVGVRCSACETRLLPPGPICTSCGGVDLVDDRVAEVEGTVAHSTIDGLAVRPGDRQVVIIDLDGGGRLRATAVEADGLLEPGRRVRFVLRRSDDGGLPNYLWKASVVEVTQ